MFDSDGNFIGYRGVDKDITSRKQMEMRVELLNRLKPRIREAVLFSAEVVYAA